MEKKCSICKEKKPLSEFVRDNSISTGYTSRCLVCERKRSKAFYEKQKIRREQERIPQFEINKEAIDWMYCRGKYARKRANA